MRNVVAVFIVAAVILLGVFGDEGITGNAVYSSKPDLTAEIVAHGVDTETNEFYVVFEIVNEGSASLEQGTTIPVRLFVRYTAPPVKHEGSTGSISTAEVFLEEAKAAYALEEDLAVDESVLVISPPIPILLSTVRFFEKYKIKNRITIEVDNDREIKEEDEKNNKLVKWYYMQEWDGFEEEVLGPEE
ncbi:hypothetical protein HZC31_03540 [Candidatus Woesearchaeota archaeon]|nr:hypothetical protein [Candidatus Woesearchaeota archaeon]